MSKRRRTTEPGSQIISKKKPRFVIGAPSADDERSVTDNINNSSSLSERHINERLQSLTTLCIQVFSKNFAKLSDAEHWEHTKTELSYVSESVLPLLFKAIKSNHPSLLRHEVIATYFLRGSSVSLSGELAGVTSHTLSAISRFMKNELRSLELTDFSKFSNKDFSRLISVLPLLESSVLRNCSKVGPSTVEALAKTCPNLTKVNLNSTNITAISLLPLLRSCPNIEVLKLANIRNLSDATIGRLFTAVQDECDSWSIRPLRKLKSLKLRHNTISENSLAPFLQRCPLLERLDVSFTSLKRIPAIPNTPPIVKLSLTSTFVSNKDLVELVAKLPNLKILNIGAMGVKAATSTAFTTSSDMTFNDDALRNLTKALINCPSIESVNLVQNQKLGALKKYDSALGYFIRHVGRRCQTLNLSGIGLRSEDLAGLMSDGEEEEISSLRTLVLNKTLIDHNCVAWISSCKNLEILEVADTRISADNLFQIILSCPRLSKLNLTGCRGVKISDRRRFFEVWEEQQAAMPS